MKRSLAIVAGLMLAVFAFVGSSSGVSAQLAGTTITIPPQIGSAVPVQALVNGTACGTPVTTSSTSSVTLTVPSSCAAPGALVTYTVGGLPITQTTTIGATPTNVTLTSVTAQTPEIITLPAGTGTVNFFVNGIPCGSATLTAAGTSSFTLPVACEIANGVLTVTLNTGQQLASTLNLGAVGGTNVLPNLNVIQPVISLPAGPAGVVTVFCDPPGTPAVQTAGTVNIVPTGATTLTLPVACSIPGSSLTLQGPCGVPLASSISLPATLSTTPIAVSSLVGATPLTVTLPAGSGALSIMSGANVLATVNLTGATQTVTLPAICPGSTISFMQGTTIVPTTLTVPSSGGGNLVLTSLGQTTVVVPVTPAVPAPAKTGNAGLVDSQQGSTWLLLGLAATAVVLVGGARVALGSRKR